MSTISGIITKKINGYNDQKEAFIENILQPWSTYEFKIIAENDFGFSEASLPSPKVNTPADHPYKAPTNITGGNGKIGDLTIVWDVRYFHTLIFNKMLYISFHFQKLSPQDQNGPGIYYKVYWRHLTLDSDFQHKTLQDYGNIGMTVVHIQPEFYYTQYEVKVQVKIIYMIHPNIFFM